MSTRTQNTKTAILGQFSGSQLKPELWTVVFWCGSLIASLSLLVHRLLTESSFPLLAGCLIALAMTVVTVTVELIGETLNTGTRPPVRFVRACTVLLPCGVVAMAFARMHAISDVFLLAQFVTGVGVLASRSRTSPAMLTARQPASALEPAIQNHGRPITAKSPATKPIEIGLLDTEPLTFDIETAQAAIASLLEDDIRQSPVSARLEAHDTTQQYRRSRLLREDELIEGEVRVRFGSDDRRQIVHLPFVPHLAHIPELECETSSRDARARVTDRRRYGARIEVTRPTSGSMEEVTLEFRVRSQNH
ncbi:MAG: hypothetical protein O3A00_08580 [Planctomycetota bacterium]|nr:hypothetical protein [Planctomycetota bacterium]